MALGTVQIIREMLPLDRYYQLIGTTTADASVLVVISLQHPRKYCSLFMSHGFALNKKRVDSDFAVITSPGCDQVASSGRTVRFGRGKFADIARDVFRRHVPFASRRRLQCSHRNSRKSIYIKELSSTILREDGGGTDLGNHSMPRRLLSSFHHPLNCSDPEEKEQRSISLFKSFHIPDNERFPQGVTD